MAPVVAIAATSQSPESLLDYQHSVWDRQDGAPEGIQSMAQTRDGWLWLGTNAGLFQFDGLSFRPRETLLPDDLRSHAIRRLVATSAGDLWIFFSAGGATVLPVNDREHPVRVSGLPDSTLFTSFAEDADGRMWASAGPDLYRSNGTVWESVKPEALGLPSIRDPELRRDERGDLWLFDENAAWLRSAHAERFSEITSFWHSIVDAHESVDGHIFIEDEIAPSRFALRQMPMPDGAPVDPSYRMSDTMMVDAHGRLWSVACDKRELCLFPSTGELDESGERSADDPWKVAGTPTPGTMCLLVDNEGNTWIGTKHGLERFRVGAATRVHFPPDTYYFAAIPRADGSVYVSTDSHSGAPTDRVWAVGRELVPASPTGHPASAWWRDDGQSILLAGTEGAWSIRNGILQPFDPPVPWSPSVGRPQAMARDHHGRLWIAYSGSSFWRKDAQGWTNQAGSGGIPAGQVATLVSSEEGLWVGYRNNALALLEDTDNVSRWDQRAGLATGTVNVVVTDSPMLVAGERGMQWFDGQRFVSLHAQAADELTGITGLLRERDGSLWVNGFKGLVRYAGADVARALADNAFAMPGRLYDDIDGVAGTAQQQRPLPTLTRGSDGRIWVASTNGLAWIDPGALPRNDRPPALAVRGINGETSAANGMLLAAGTRDVTIGFDVVSLSRGDRVKTRYRLIGSDGDWIDAGLHREAVFSNLAPGAYRFEVIAGNEDGVWVAQGATLAFSLAPTLFQTIWFKALCVLLGGVAIWAAFVLRLRHERALLRQTMAVRHAERDRIARELHDTLLQGISGLLMRMQAWASRVDLPPRLHDDIEHASDQGRQMLSQGRDRIAELRSSDEEPVLLARAIEPIGSNLMALRNLRFVLSDDSPGATVRSDVAVEVCAIVREAIANACVHSGGSEVSATIERKGNTLTITVADDGCGIGSRELSDASSAGHWGIVGMRERARRIGAQLTVAAAESGGTRVTLKGVRVTASAP